jgi:ribosomal protein L19E
LGSGSLVERSQKNEKGEGKRMGREKEDKRGRTNYENSWVKRAFKLTACIYY